MALIILGHPDIEHSLANKTIIEQLEQSGLDLEIRNIAQLYPDYNINIEAEQEALLRHDTIVLQYPIFWYSMPAILKHWIDKVFAYQFAFGSEGDKLKGKKLLASVTTGGPQDAYHPLGHNHFRIGELLRNIEQTAYYSQMQYVDTVSLHNANLLGNTVENILANAKEHGQKFADLLRSLA